MQQDFTQPSILTPVPLDSGIVAVEPALGAGGLMLDEPVGDDARATIESALSDNTIRVYNAALKAWSVYALDRGLRPLPASESSVINYLQHLAGQGKSLSSVRVVAASLSKAHKVAGLASPLESPRVRLFMRGLSRRIGKPQKQAQPLDDNALSAIEATARVPRPGRGGKMESPQAALARGLVDVAIVRVLSDAALRRGEAVALDWRDVRDDQRGGIIMVKRSKTDVSGQGMSVWISRKAMSALNAIRPDNYEGGDPVFTSAQSIRNGVKGKYRMTERQLSRRVAAAARAAGLGEGYSGHSGRVGFVARATRRNAPTDAMMRHARWRSPAMVAVYGRNEAGAEILPYISG